MKKIHPSSFQVKILDFGLARATDDQAHLTQSGAIIGTPQYMAPEQGRGEKLDARCDLWSLGVVLYRMATGEMPFRGADTVSTLMSVAMNNPPPPAKINRATPAELSKLIMKLLEKDPAKRLGSAQEVADSLRTLEQSSQHKQEKAAAVVKPKPERAGRVSDRSKSRKPLLLALAGGLVAAVIAAVIVFFWPTQGGVIRVEINDDDIEVAFPQGGMTFKGKDGQVIKVTPGKKVGPHVKRGELEFDTEEFTLKSGETVTLKVEWLREGKLQVVRGDTIIGDKSLKLPVEATNKIGMKMMLIPPAGAALPEAYYLGKYEVTQGEWEQVMGYNPSNFGPQNAKVADTSNFPVEMVTWYDCVEFCNELSKREGWKPYYQLTETKRSGKDGKQIDAAAVKILGGNGYHIPTEAEWEHGCRAGTKTRYHFGDKDADLPDYAWFNRNSQNRTHGVGEKKPNAFGLYDMHGNVWEWCEDLYHPRGLRGGSWNFSACRAADRHSTALSRSSSWGFRLARVPSARK